MSSIYFKNKAKLKRKYSSVSTPMTDGNFDYQKALITHLRSKSTSSDGGKDGKRYDTKLGGSLFLLFAFLSDEEVFSASFVCHTWAAAAHRPEVWRDILVQSNNVAPLVFKKWNWWTSRDARLSHLRLTNWMKACTTWTHFHESVISPFTGTLTSLTLPLMYASIQLSSAFIDLKPLVHLRRLRMYLEQYCTVVVPLNIETLVLCGGSFGSFCVFFEMNASRLCESLTSLFVTDMPQVHLHQYARMHHNTPARVAYDAFVKEKSHRLFSKVHTLGIKCAFGGDVGHEIIKVVPNITTLCVSGGCSVHLRPDIGENTQHLSTLIIGSGSWVTTNIPTGTVASRALETVIDLSIVSYNSWMRHTTFPGLKNAFTYASLQEWYSPLDPLQFLTSASNNNNTITEDDKPRLCNAVTVSNRVEDHMTRLRDGKELKVDAFYSNNITATGFWSLLCAHYALVDRIRRGFDDQLRFVGMSLVELTTPPTGEHII